MKRCPECNKKIKDQTRFCPFCGRKFEGRTTAEKKSRLTGNTKSKRSLYIMAGVLATVAFVLIAAGSYLFHPQTEVLKTASASEVAFDVDDFADGSARYYKYKIRDGREIRFFILKSSDGIIRAAFDSCDVCYPAKLGYRQEGDMMVCNNCEQTFISTSINELRGGCNPAPLDRRLEGGKLVIGVASILEGARYF